MGRIFISYRRSDAAAMSGRIYDAMAKRFGRRRVFRDKEDIPVGARFPEFLRQTLYQCQVAFVLIGPAWLSATNPDGSRRLDDPQDFVRQEVETALNRGSLVCPLLLDGASMPRAADLPAEIREVHWHNALAIRDDPAGFAQDMQRLAADIKQAVEGKGGPLVERFGIVGRTTAVPLAGVAGAVIGASAVKGGGVGDLIAKGCATTASKVTAAVVGIAIVATVGVAVLRPSLLPFPSSRAANRSAAIATHTTATRTPTHILTNASSEYVLDTGGNLWFEDPPFGAASRPRTAVDANVLSFQALSSTSAYVLGTNGALWYETGPWGTVPPPRQEVDANVAAFQAIDKDTAFVLGSNGRLWYEQENPWGTVPPPQRNLVDSNVAHFQAIGSGSAVYVLNNSGALVLDTPTGGGSFKDWTTVGTQPVDTGVTRFQGLSSTDVYELDAAQTLWLVHLSPASRVKVDQNVLAFQATSASTDPDPTTTLFVLDTAHTLWLDSSPWGAIPPPRSQVTSNVIQFKALDHMTVYILGSDGSLSVRTGPQLSTSTPLDGNVSAFQAAADQTPSAK